MNAKFQKILFRIFQRKNYLNILSMYNQTRSIQYYNSSDYRLAPLRTTFHEPNVPDPFNLFCDEKLLHDTAVNYKRTCAKKKNKIPLYMNSSAPRFKNEVKEASTLPLPSPLPNLIKQSQSNLSQVESLEFYQQNDSYHNFMQKLQQFENTEKELMKLLPKRFEVKKDNKKSKERILCDVKKQDLHQMSKFQLRERNLDTEKKLKISSEKNFGDRLSYPKKYLEKQISSSIVIDSTAYHCTDYIQRNKYPFNSTAPRKPITCNKEVPSAATYNVHQPWERNVCQLDVEGEISKIHYMVPMFGIRCGDLKDSCILCKDLIKPVEYWHSRFFGPMCDECYDKELKYHQHYKAIQLEEFKPVRHCSFIHKHIGTKIYLTKPINLIKNFLRKEAYFAKFQNDGCKEVKNMSRKKQKQWKLERENLFAKHAFKYEPKKLKRKPKERPKIKCAINKEDVLERIRQDKKRQMQDVQSSEHTTLVDAYSIDEPSSDHNVKNKVGKSKKRLKEEEEGEEEEEEDELEKGISSVEDSSGTISDEPFLRDCDSYSESVSEYLMEEEQYLKDIREMDMHDRGDSIKKKIQHTGNSDCDIINLMKTLNVGEKLPPPPKLIESKEKPKRINKKFGYGNDGAAFLRFMIKKNVYSPDEDSDFD